MCSSFLVIHVLQSRETSGVSLPQRQAALILGPSSMKGCFGPVALLMKGLGASTVEINSCAYWLFVPSYKRTVSLLG